MSTETTALSGPQSADPTGPASPSTPVPQSRSERRELRAREQLRVAQQELDAVRGQRDRLVDVEVRRLLSARVSDVDLALRATGKAPGDFLTDQGTVDAAAVAAFAEDVTVRAPGLRRGPATVDGSQHRVRGDQLLAAGRSAGWADVWLNSGRSRGADPFRVTTGEQSG